MRPPRTAPPTGWYACIFLALLAGGCAARHPVETGYASWYGPGFAGRPTASGETFRPWRRTAAHKSLPFGTVVRVERTDTGERVKVTVNDRGPYVDGRIIDLSRRSARRIDLLDDGVAPVEVNVLRCRRASPCQAQHRE